MSTLSTAGRLVDSVFRIIGAAVVGSVLLITILIRFVL